MPVYQYACTDCGEQLEVRQSFTDDSLTVCPACSGRLRKVLSAVGVVFKGSGFYRTDSRTDAKSAATATADSGSSEKSTSTKESSTKESSPKESSTSSTTAATPVTSTAPVA